MGNARGRMEGLLAGEGAETEQRRRVLVLIQLLID
jgi:hypothetical protein